MTKEKWEEERETHDVAQDFWKFLEIRREERKKKVSLFSKGGIGREEKKNLLMYHVVVSTKAKIGLTSLRRAWKQHHSRSGHWHL